MAYETPKSAKTETFVESAAPKLVYSGEPPKDFLRLKSPHNLERGGVMFNVQGAIEVSLDGLRPLFVLTSDAYVPLTFPIYIRAAGPKTKVAALLLNYTLGGSNVRE